jgi:hypothetical protein
MELVLENMSGLSSLVFDSEFSLNDFEDYIGVDGKSDESSLVLAFMTKETEVIDLLADMDSTTMELGFARLDKIFEMLDDLRQVKSILPLSFFKTRQAYGSLEVNSIGVDTAIAYINFLPEIDISDTEPIMEAIGYLASYYNGLNDDDKVLFYDYFESFGFILIQTETDSTEETSTGTTDSSSGVTTTTVNGQTKPSSEFFDSLLDLGGDYIIPEGTALFSDIASVTWAWTAIRQLYIAGIVKGKGDGLFDPNGMITRAEFAVMLSRMLELDQDRDVNVDMNVFEDVTNDQWYFNEVYDVYKAGYIVGDGQKQYNPEDSISREAIATILERVLLDKGIKNITDDESNDLLSQFEDKDQVSAWAKNGTALLVKYDIIKGSVLNNDMVFNFNTSGTRAEVSVILYRIANIIETKVTVFTTE